MKMQGLESYTEIRNEQMWRAMSSVVALEMSRSAAPLPR